MNQYKLETLNVPEQWVEHTIATEPWKFQTEKCGRKMIKSI